MAIRRVLPTGVATGGSGADYAANACGTINEASAAATDTYLLASTDTAFTGLTFACAKGTAATPNRYLDVASGNLSSYGALIDACESGWTPANGASVAYTAVLIKNGTANKLRIILPAVPAANTLYAYKTITSVSLEAFSQLSFWLRSGSIAGSANQYYSINLCSDTAGVTTVKSIPITGFLGQDTTTCFNFLWSNISTANIQSIAFYSGSVTPVTVAQVFIDSIYATVAGFDLNSVLHKSFNYRGVSWAPNTAIALNEIRVPTFGARSPLVYKCAFAGTTGATEYFTDADGTSKPIWDKAYLPAMGNFPNQTVLDGTCVWEVLGNDEAYYFWAIKSLDFTANGGKGRIEIDNHPANVGNAGRGYYGTDETVAMSYLTPYLYPMAAAATTVMDSIGGSGTDAIPRTISGGYNTSDVVVGVTFISGRNGLGYGLQNSAKSAVIISGGIGFVRYGRALFGTGIIPWMKARHYIGVGITDRGIMFTSSTSLVLTMQFCKIFSNGSSAYSFDITGSVFRGSFGNMSNGHLGAAFNSAAVSLGSCSGMLRTISVVNGAGYGIASCDGMTFINLVTAYNAIAAFSVTNGVKAQVKNGSISESTVAGAFATTSGFGNRVLIQNFNGTTGDNRAYYPSMGQATYATATHIWTIAVNSVNATQQIPLRHELGPVRVDTVGVPCTISVQVNPSAANIKCQLKIPANVIAGVQFDTYSESSGSGLQTLTTTFTPLEAGIFKPVLDCSINDTTLTSTIAFDLDSFAATQNGVALAVAGIGDQLFGEEMFVSRGDVLTLAQEAARNISAGAANFLVGVTERIQGVDIPGALSLSYINTITPTGSAVAGGATATITGSGFSASGNAVAFGSTALGWTAATIITETITSITVVIPAGSANTVGVRVTNALAQVATLTNCFVYYATPTSHVKQRIIDAIIYGLGQITENNGYNYTIRRVYDPPTGFTEMEEFPAVNVYDGEETCANGNIGSHLQTGGNNAMLHNSFVVTLDCVLTTTPNQATARQDRYKFLADVQKYFGKNYWIPNEYSEGTARCCFYQRSTPFGIESNRNDITGISIDFIVWYDQELTNPTSRG